MKQRLLPVRAARYLQSVAGADIALKALGNARSLVFWSGRLPPPRRSIGNRYIPGILSI